MKFLVSKIITKPFNKKKIKIITKDCLLFNIRNSFFLYYIGGQREYFDKQKGQIHTETKKELESCHAIIALTSKPISHDPSF